MEKPMMRCSSSSSANNKKLEDAVGGYSIYHSLENGQQDQGMNNDNKEQQGLGFTAEECDFESEFKMISIDDDDDKPNIQQHEENQFNAGSTDAVEEYCDDFGFESSDDAHDQDYSNDKFYASMRIEWERELEKNGIDLQKFHEENWPDFKGKCDFCNSVDKHPMDDCPYADEFEI